MGLSELCRKLILDRKNRSLIVNSESCKGNLPEIFEFMVKNLDKSADEIDLELEKLDDDETNTLNEMLQGVVNLCKDEWIGGNNPVEIIEDESKRKHCSLCNQPNNKWVFNIRNKINGKKMNVGSTCIDEFPSIELRRGKTRSQLQKEAERLAWNKQVTHYYPGILKKIENWDSQVNNYEILITNDLVNPYLEIGEKIKDIIEDYKSDRSVEDRMDLINSLLVEAEKCDCAIGEYVEENRESEFVVTRNIVKWLRKRNDLQTLDYLKRDGFIDSKTISMIYEHNFITSIVDRLNFIFDDINVMIVHCNFEKNGFVIKPYKNSSIKLFSKFKDILSCYGWILVGDSKYNAKVSLKNIVRISTYSDSSTLSKIIDVIGEQLKKVNIFSLLNNETVDYIELGEIDIYDNKEQMVYVTPLIDFFNQYKIQIFNLENFDEKDLKSYLKERGKKYSRKELTELREVSREYESR
ncbi:MAG: hypothetical protein K0S80_2949 [Neobacillus sp.]|nr:hypothetical protein [Neobacillus sp.]